MAMLETIRKIRQFCRKVNAKYRKVRDEMQRQRIISEMEEAGVIVLQ